MSTLYDVYKRCRKEAKKSPHVSVSHRFIAATCKNYLRRCNIS